MLNKTQQLQRTLFTALPYGYRVAKLFEVLAADSMDSFGRPIYAEFLKHSVANMPDPGPRWNGSNPNTLPPKYGYDFAKKVYHFLLRKFRDPEFVETVMVDFVIRFTLQGGSSNLREHSALKEAEAYVTTGVMKQALNELSSQRRKKRDNRLLDGLPTDSEGFEMDLSDPHSYRELEDMVPAHQLQRLFKELDRSVHPDASTYITLRGEGYEDKAIIGNPSQGQPGMLPNYSQTYQNWMGNIKPEIQNFFRKNLS